MKGSSLSEEQCEASAALFATAWGSRAVASKLRWLGKQSSGCTTVQ
jgi:hypothetical protein